MGFFMKYAVVQAEEYKGDFEQNERFGLLNKGFDLEMKPVVELKTRDGLVRLHSGEYVAKDGDNLWVIGKQTIEENYVEISDELAQQQVELQEGEKR